MIAFKEKHKSLSRIKIIVITICSMLIISTFFLLPFNFTSKSTPPNVIFILIDTLRARNLSCYGYKIKTTPSMDALADKSLLFLNAYTVSGSTPPSMAALMTGRLPHYRLSDVWENNTYHGMVRFFNDDDELGLPRSLTVLAEYFQKEGYATAGIITNPYVKKVYNFHQGFDFYKELFKDASYMYDVYGRGKNVSEEAIKWLKNNQRRKPFFIYLHYMDTHFPYFPPKEYRKFFNYSQNVDEEKINRSIIELNHIWNYEKDIPDDAQGKKDLAATMMAIYDSSIYYVDDCIQDILHFLEQKKLMDNTIVAILADHGEEFLEHGGTTHKATFYEEMLHVPFILHIPGVQHRVIENQIRHFDLMPTLLDYTGINFNPDEFDARSLRAIIEDKAGSSQLPVFSNFPYAESKEYNIIRNHGQMFLDQKIKLIYYPRHPEKSQLFDLSNDLKERHNLFNNEEYKNKQADLIEKIEYTHSKLDQEYIRTKGDAIKKTKSGKTLIDKKTMEQLRSLGYVE